VNKIYWLASYPKSGNTWVRVFLANFLGDGTRPADINHLRGGPIASDRDVFDRWAGVEASDLPLEEIANLRPEVYRQVAMHIDHPLYIKVHDACTRNAEGQLLFPPDVTGGVLYLIRNPLDVAVSYAHHGGRTLQETVESLCNPRGSVYEMPDRMSLQLPQRLMSWGDHVRSWVDGSLSRVTVVRYEDMHALPGIAFREVLRALDLEPETTRLSHAVSLSDFRTVREQELKFGFREKHMRADAPFFRQGRVGAWREELTPDLADRIVTAQGEEMRRFGYLDPDGRPVY
jgi:aryl sulfotransferase